MGLMEIQRLKSDAANKKPRTRYINPKSEKRVTEEKEYLKKREVFLKKHPVCEAKVECKGDKAVNVHHKKGRVGKNYLDEKTWLACCFKCHQFLELNPRLAKQLLLSNSRLKKNA